MSTIEKSPPRQPSPAADPEVVEQDQDRNKAQKRKASSPPPEAHVSTVTSKRGRIDGALNERGAISDASHAPKDRGADRRQSASQEEKSRGKRLFGSFLSTLSQTNAPSSQQKRRQDIERRQHAKVSQQRAEDDKQRQEKLAKLNVARKIEQIRFDEQVMHTRHSNMLATARFLQTKSTPKIYYLPWKSTEQQKDVIEDQIQDAEDAIDKEASDFKRHKEQRLKALGVAAERPAPPMPESKETPRKTANDSFAEISQPDSTNHAPPQAAKVGHERESEENGDVMVEEAEDTVIY